MSNEDQPCLHEVDPEILCSSEPDPLIPIGVDISPPTAFSDTTENQETSEHTEVAQKPECFPSHGLSLVASLRLAASEQEKERELERERREKERIENEKREERERQEKEEAERRERERVEKEKEERQRLENEREEIERKARERMEREKEEERKRLETKQREEREKAEKERKHQTERKHVEEKENEERERKMEKEKRKEDEQRMRQREEDSKLQQKQEVISATSLQNKQEVTNNQSNDCPPLREAELDDIAYDEKLQRDEEQSESKSDPKSVKMIESNAEVKLVSARPADSVPPVEPTNRLDSRSVKPEDSVIPAKKALDNPALRSAKKGKSNLKSGAIPVWLREEEDEEVEYERGQEDLGSIWLAELYMEGGAG